MANKKIHINNMRSTMLFIVIGIFIFNFLNWVKLVFPWLTQTSLLSKFSDIHFSSPWNNFWGWIFWLPTDSLTTPQTITAWWITKKCNKQLRWIYYNAARWGRLWPLDQKTLNLLNTDLWYNWLTVTGWFYTACDDSYWIYWYVKHTWGWNALHLLAWTKLDYQQNNFLSSFANIFEYFNNVTPLWYIWDSVWGIWFVWWNITWSENLINSINSGSSINNSFVITWWNIISVSPNRSINLSWSAQAQDTMWNILIQGSMFIWSSISSDEKKAILWNIEKRTIIMSSNFNPSDVINPAKKNTEILCRGKTVLEDTVLPNNNDKVLCYKNSNLNINLYDYEKYKDKTIIMRDWNIILENTMNKDNPSLDIFIDKWILYIKNNPGTKQSFNQDWYPSENWITNSGIFIKGNLVINWLLLGTNNTTPTTTPIDHKVHILWRIAFLNTPTTPSEWRVTQVRSVLWTWAFDQRINLENIFNWNCDFEWKASDQTSCWNWETAATTTPFIVLNANYPSNIIK